MLYDNSPIFPLLFFTSLAAIPFAAFYLRRALRGVRRGHQTPTCPTCSYLLTGLTLPTPCPECGTPASPANSYLGPRTGRPILLPASASLLALSCAIAYFTFNEYYSPRIPWVHYRPASLLLSDLSAGSGPPYDAAAKEFLRRMASRSPSNSTLNNAVATLLARFDAAAGPNSTEGRLLRTLYERQQLTPAEALAFFRSRFLATLTVRPYVVAGDPVPLQLAFTDKAGDPARLLVIPATLSIDDGTPQTVSTTTTWSSASYSYPDHLRILAPSDKPPGQHTLRLGIRVIENSSTPQPLSVDLTFSTPLTIIPADRAQPPTPASTAALNDYLHTYALAGNAIHSDSQGNLSFLLGSYKSPADLAYDVIVHTNNTDYPAGTLTLARNQSAHFPFFLPAIPGHPFSRPIDLILRPNPALVRQTPDLTTYPDSPLLFPDVRIDSLPASRPINTLR